MSIAIVISVHDGLVIAADSASTLTINTPAGIGVANVYNNANKIFNLIKGSSMGCVTYGSGSIGNASIATLIKDFRGILTDEAEAKKRFGFDRKKYTMEQVSKLLADFLGQECEKIQDKNLRQTISIGLMVGGYSSGETLGEVWSIEVQQGLAGDPKKLRQAEQVGINWGGESEAIHRLVLGFSPRIFDVMAQVMKPPQPPAALVATLQPLLVAQLNAPLVFAPMPIQDAIDLGEFLVHSAVTFSRFLPGAQSVGGPIEVAAITKHEGFKWIRRKYYYKRDINPDDLS
jgi:hypothetical protein